MKTPDPQSLDPSVSLVQTEETAENTDAPEPAAGGHIKLNYSSDYLCSPNIGMVTNNYFKNLGEYMHCLIIWKLSGLWALD
jgi:hypothetical protein